MSIFALSAHAHKTQGYSPQTKSSRASKTSSTMWCIVSIRGTRLPLCCSDFAFTILILLALSTFRSSCVFLEAHIAPESSTTTSRRGKYLDRNPEKSSSSLKKHAANPHLLPSQRAGPRSSKAHTKEDCPICYNQYTNPVSLTPCNHIFDHACITTWLAQGQKHNTCPLCKTELFTLPREETLSQAELRREQVGHALRISNLVSREPPFDDYGCKKLDPSSLMRAVARATYTLGQDGPRTFERISGPCMIDIKRLAPAFVAMANLVPALAEAREASFSTAEVQAWKIVCQCLWTETRVLGGRKADAMVLAAVLKNKTREALAKREGPSQAGPLSLIDGERGEWMDLLLNYLVLTAWRAQQEKEKTPTTAQPKKEKCVVM